MQENKGAEIRAFREVAKECGSKREKRSYFGLGKSGGEKSSQVIENTRGENGA